MTKEQAGRVFERFHRGENARAHAPRAGAVGWVDGAASGRQFDPQVIAAFASIPDRTFERIALLRLVDRLGQQASV